MGRHLGVYIGVYLEVPYKKETISKVRFKNPITGLEARTRFHPSTGEKNIEEPYSEVVNHSPNPYDFEALNLGTGMENDYFWSPEYCGFKEHGCTLLLNRRTKYSLEIDDESSFNQEITNLNGLVLVEEFKVEHKNYIDYLENEFGKVNVRYGIAVYTN